MKFHPVGLPVALIAGALLLVAAQDAPTPPAEGSSFSEAFSEQSNAAKAERTAEALAQPATVTPEAAPTADATDAAMGPPAKPATALPKTAEAADAPDAATNSPAEPAISPSEPSEAADDSDALVEPPAKPLSRPAAAPSEAAVEATPAKPAPPAKLAKGDPVTHDFLVGVWAEPTKSCEAGIDFQADGKMIGPFPRWELTEGELTMVGNRQKMRLTVIDQDTMLSRRSETDPGRTLKRCAKQQP